MRTKSFGFTLAEVLITLGIIGIVAAMTLPALTAKYKKKEYSTRIKKFYSIMLQARQRSTVDNEDPIYWDTPDNNADSLESWWNKYYAPYFSVLKTEKNTNKLAGSIFLVYFTDGSILGLSKGGAVNLWYDVNGDIAPNVGGKDRFFFIQTIDGKKNMFTPYNWTADIDSTNDKLEDGEEPFTKNMTDRNNVLRLCAKNSMHCSQLLFLDGWEFKDDYPFNI